MLSVRRKKSKRKTARTKLHNKTQLSIHNLFSAFRKRHYLIFALLFGIVGAAALLLIQAESYTVKKYVWYDAAASAEHEILHEEHMGDEILERDSVSGYLHNITSFSIPLEQSTRIRFQDTSTGQAANVQLPTYPGIVKSSVWAYDNTIWTLGEWRGQILVKQYAVEGLPLPVKLIEKASYNFGDSDSRLDKIIELKSGAIIFNFHQQSSSDTKRETIGYLPNGSTQWQIQQSIYMRTNHSHGVIAQHPADNSIWAFRIADAWGAMGAARYTEINGTLRPDWSNATFVYNDELWKVDPENPSLQVAADTITQDLVLAYQGAHERKYFGDTSTKLAIGSYPVILRLNAAGIKSYTRLPIYVERVSQLGLVVRSGEVWLSYFPLDTQTLTFDRLQVSSFSGNQWQHYDVGKTKANVGSGKSRPEFLFTGEVGRVDAPVYRSIFMSMIDAGTIPLVEFIPPTIKLSEPTQNAVLSGTVSLLADASDDTSVAKVEFQVNGALVGTATTAPYKISWDTKTATSAGSYGVTAKAYDPWGNISMSSSVNVYINNTNSLPPSTLDTTAPTSPTNLTTSSITNSSATLFWDTSTDNVGVKEYQIFRKSGKERQYLMVGKSQNRNYSDSNLKGNTSYSYYVIALDAAGNASTASAIVSIKTPRR